MPSSLFPKSSGNSLLDAVMALRGMGANPQAVYEQMYQANPQFRSFADSVKDKTPEQAFREHGYDYAKLQGLIR